MRPITPINFLHEYESTQERRKAARRFGSLAIVGVVAVILSSPTLRSPLLPPSVERVVGTVEKFSLFRLASSADRTLQGEREDRINILLLGVGGGDHDGALLTDTIIMASIKPSANQVGFLSFPRDLVVPAQNGQWRKINSIHADAELANPGSGLNAIRSTIESLSGLTIPYVARIDFEGFVQLIDELGGIDIVVERTLEDYRYPILGRETDPIYENRFEHLLIPKGLQRMDGSLALKFARSRYGLGGEGSDFSRSRRQQQVLTAVKDKLLSASTLLSPRKLSAILNLLQQHTATTMEVWEILRLKQLADGMDAPTITVTVLDDSPASPLASSRGIDGAYILVPKGGTFDRVKETAQRIFEQPEIIAPPGIPSAASAPTRLTSGNVTVAVLNGTTTAGYANRVKRLLEGNGWNVGTIGNAPIRNDSATMVYFDGGYEPLKSAAETIAQLVGGSLSSDRPQWLNLSSSSTITVVLGPEQ